MRTFRAPGRVNLCGEHTDYNQGYVLPVALDMECRAAAAAAENGRLKIDSALLGPGGSYRVEDLASIAPRGDWSDYAFGTARQLALAGIEIPAAEISVKSTVPLGAGLGSSAALEASVALALTHLAGRELPRLEIAGLCRFAEREFAGIHCGIMDQFVSLHGAENRAVLLDCRSLEHRLIALPAGIRIVVVDSGVKHKLAASAYNRRVSECAEAARCLGVESLREVSVEDWPAVEPKLADIPRRRARHIVHENRRVLAFVDACAREDAGALREIMRAAHQSLAVDYEVSCPELDFLVDAASPISGVIGARMTGGGFGGCTVNLVCEEAVESFCDEIAARYTQTFRRAPRVYRCRASAGASEVKQEMISSCGAPTPAGI